MDMVEDGLEYSADAKLDGRTGWSMETYDQISDMTQIYRLRLAEIRFTDHNLG